MRGLLVMTCLVGLASPLAADQPPNVGPVHASCDGLTCNFWVETSDDVGIVSHDWTYGDGSFDLGFGSIANHTYLGSGYYWVDVTVRDTAGQTNWNYAMVQVSCECQWWEESCTCHYGQ